MARIQRLRYNEVMNSLKLWNQFLGMLSSMEADAAHGILPAQATIEALQNQCLDLSGNCSAFYAWFLKVSELAGISSYAYEDLPKIDSEDGYLCVFDNDFRAKFISVGTNPFTIDQMYQRRFVPFIWQRSFHLQTIGDSHEVINLRAADTKEISRFCINAMPYQLLHGLGISEYTDNIVCDIEKLAWEAEFLNPAANRELLPGEHHFNVGQNSHTGSSIPKVLHSHHSVGTLEEIKLYSDANSPNALEIMQVGTKQDALLIRLITDSVTEAAYLNFCIWLRMRLEMEFGTKVIDLHFHIMPTRDGRFATIIAPFAKLVQQKDSNNVRFFMNPETGENNVDLQVAPHLHLGNASKKWAVRFSDQSLLKACLKDGHGRLAALYDFTAKSGTRSMVQEYIAHNNMSFD